MNKLEHPLIAKRQTRQLSALGYQQLNRFIAKACKINGTHRLDKSSNDLVNQVRVLVFSLIFDHNISKEDLSFLQYSIKINNGQLQLPTHSTINL